MNTDEIKVLPPKHYKQVYGEDYDAQKWKLRFDGLSDSEKKSLAPILEVFSQIKNAYWIPEVNQPDGKKTPDLLIDGRRVEIKEIKKKNSPEDQTKKAVEQVGENGWVIFDTTGNDQKRGKYLHDLERKAFSRGLKNYAVVKDGKIEMLVNIDKEKRTINRLPFSSGKPTSESDIKFFYDSILSQKPQKVNHQTHKLAPESFKKPTKYWEQRSLQRTIEAEKLAKPYLARLRMEYRASSDRAIDQIRRIYETYFGEAGFDRQKLREITPSGDLSRYIKEVRSLGVALPDNYQYRVNREEFLHAQLWLEAQKLGAFEQNISNELYSKVINRSFERTFGDYGGNFARLNEQTMSEILDSKFHGKNFSTRIWGRTNRLAEELHAKLAFAIAKGEGWERTSREIRERFGVAQSSAERLIRTETNYFENRAELAAYQELDIKEFEFLAALDGRTSEICRHHHGKRYKVEKGKSGENIPPLHPNCRSTIVAVVPELGDVSVDIKTAPEIITPQETGEKIGVKISKPAPVSVANAINFDQPEVRALDQGIVKPQMKEASSIMKAYPKVAEYLAEKGGLNVRVTRARKSLASVTSGESASTGRTVSIVSLNFAKTYYSNYDRFIATVEKGVKSGYYMPIARKNFEKYTMSHELGHVVQDYLKIKDGGNSRVLARQHKNDILEIASKKSGLAPSQVEDKFMSKYGKKLDVEFFAEAFAGMRNGIKNPITQAMEQFLKEKM